MSATDHARPRRAWGGAAPDHTDRVARRHARPLLRRSRTRRGAVRRALREEGLL